MNAQLAIALSKGQIYEETQPLLTAAGIHAIENPEQSRKLIIKTNHDSIRLNIVHAIYVQCCAANCGIAEKDVLIGNNSKDLYQPLDLHIVNCQMMIAVRKSFNYTLAYQPSCWVYVVTKYAITAAKHFASKGNYIDLIILYGSIELVPLVALSDVIVDLVSGRNSFKANNLEAVEHIIDIVSRLVNNKAVLKLKNAIIQPIIDILAQVTHLNLNNSLYQQET